MNSREPYNLLREWKRKQSEAASGGEPFKPILPGYLAIRWCSRLKPPVRLIATELYSYTYYDNGVLRSGDKTTAHLVRALGLGRSTVKRALIELAEEKLLDRESHRFALTVDFVNKAMEERRERGEGEGGPDRAMAQNGPRPRTGHGPDRATGGPDRSTAGPDRATGGPLEGHIKDSVNSKDSKDSYPRRPDTRERSLEERERIESARRAQAEEEQRRRDQYNAEVRAILNTY